MSDPQTLQTKLESCMEQLEVYSLEAYEHGERVAEIERRLFTPLAAYLTTLTKENGYSSDKLREAATGLKFPELREVEFHKAMNKRLRERCDDLKTQISAQQSLLKLEIEKRRV